MGIYLGNIQIKSGKYVNFKPIYEYTSGGYNYLTSLDRSNLLPDSSYGDINLNFDNNSKAESYFKNDEYIFLDFTLSDLEDNYSINGERNQTGYRLNLNSFSSSRIKKLHDYNLYYVIKENDLTDSYKMYQNLY